MRKRAIAALIAVTAVLTLTGAPAALAAPAAAVEWPEFEPSSSKPRAWMLNILGSVLGSAMPDKWRAEQLANAHRYNHSWEMMGAQFGTDPANPNYMGAPDSHDDYVLRKTEMDIKGGTGDKPMKAPATKCAKLVKGVGGALVALTGLELVITAGNGFMDLIGFDVEGTVCWDDEEDGGLWSLVTGADCEGWRMTQEAIAQANSDINAGLILPAMCVTETVSGSEFCAEILSVNFDIAAGTPQDVVCLAVTKDGAAMSSGQLQTPRVEWVKANGETVSTVVPGATLVAGTQWFKTACGPGGAGFYAQGFASSSGYAPVGLIEYQLLGANWVRGSEFVPIEDAEANPPRQLVCSIEGSDGHTYTAMSEVYTEDDGTIAAPQCPELPDGVTPATVEIVDTEGNELWQEDVNPEWLDWWTTYPECRTGACKLDLVVLGGSAPVSCFDLDGQCADWFSDPDKASNYECIYGIHTVALSECNVYAGLFKPGRIEVGAPYSDPMTGDWSGGVNAPSPDRQALAQDIQDPGVSRACTGMAVTGFDPVGFVMRPIQCALEWAFVPRPAVAELAGTQLAGAFEQRAPGQLVGMVGGWQFTPSMSGCSKTVNWSPNTFAEGDPEPFVVWDLCPGSSLEFLGVMSRLITGAVFAVMVFLGVRRYVSGMVDYR